MNSPRKIRAVQILIVALPLWLIGSGAFALYKYFEKQRLAELAEIKRFSQDISAENLEDNLRKIIQTIGERNLKNPRSLAATSSMLRGSLGPSNTGFSPLLIKTTTPFPIISCEIPGQSASLGPIWVITSYDSPPDSPGAEKNASGLVATLAVAEKLASSRLEKPIHFLLLPHANDPDSPVLETASIVANLIQNSADPTAIFCIEAMGDAERLILTSRDPEAIPTDAFAGLGEVKGAEITCLGDDFDLSSTLFELGLPAIRIATRPTLLPGEDDFAIPFAPTLAASTARLATLIRRLAEK